MKSFGAIIKGTNNGWIVEITFEDHEPFAYVFSGNELPRSHDVSASELLIKALEKISQIEAPKLTA
jgi:hypothetical protein